MAYNGYAIDSDHYPDAEAITRKLDALIRKPIGSRFIRSFLYYVPYVTLSVMTFPAIVEATQVPAAGAAALALGIVLGKSTFGRKVYAVGGNQQSALMLGINVFGSQFFGIQIVFLIQYHIRCNIIGTGTHCNDKHTGVLRPYSSPIFAPHIVADGLVGVLYSSDGVIGNGYDRRTCSYCGHGSPCRAFLYVITDSNDRVVRITVEVIDSVMVIRLHEIVVGRVVRQLPITLSYQVVGLADTHGLEAAFVDINQNIRHIGLAMLCRIMLNELGRTRSIVRIGKV